MSSQVLNNNNIKSFTSQAKAIKIGVDNKPPRFKVGDIIINTKYKVISRVVDIRSIFENEDKTVNYEVAEYVLKDYKNKSRDDWQKNHMHPSIVDNKKVYKRMKLVRAIDAFYELLPSEAAQLLYGIKE